MTIHDVAKTAMILLAGPNLGVLVMAGIIYTINSHKPRLISSDGVQVFNLFLGGLIGLMLSIIYLIG